jgi:hypothetical protein
MQAQLSEIVRLPMAPGALRGQESRADIVEKSTSTFAKGGFRLLYGIKSVFFQLSQKHKKK